jgi:hypothetical protein
MSNQPELQYYTVIRHSDEINIGWEINRKLREGYKLQGGISAIINARGEKEFFQAMVKGGNTNE